MVRGFSYDDVTLTGGDAGASFGMRDHIDNNIRAGADQKIETPVFGDARLPKIVGFVVLLARRDGWCRF